MRTFSLVPDVKPGLTNDQSGRRILRGFQLGYRSTLVHPEM